MGEEDAKQIGIGLRLRITEDELIDLYGIDNQPEFLGRKRCLAVAIDGYGLLHGIRHTATLQNHQEIGPILTFTQSGHGDFGASLCINDDGEESYLTVALHLLQRLPLRRDDDTAAFAIIVAH